MNSLLAANHGMQLCGRPLPVGISYSIAQGGFLGKIHNEKQALIKPRLHHRTACSPQLHPPMYKK